MKCPLLDITLSMSPSSYVRPKNPEGFDPARKERIHLHPVENVECSVPAVGVFTEIKVNRAENTTKSNVAIEGRYEKPHALTLPSSSTLHTMQDPYLYTQVSHTTADRVFVFVERGWGKKRGECRY